MAFCGKKFFFILHVFTAVTDIFRTFALNANFLTTALLSFSSFFYLLFLEFYFFYF